MTYLWNMPRDKHGRPGGGDVKRRKSKARKGATVIHVAFGSGGGRLDATPGEQAEQAKPGAIETRAAAAGGRLPATVPPPADALEPVTDLFSRREVAKLLGVSE